MCMYALLQLMDRSPVRSQWLAADAAHTSDWSSMNGHQIKAWEQAVNRSRPTHIIRFNPDD